jgi:membrane dipeptidase
MRKSAKWLLVTAALLIGVLLLSGAVVTPLIESRLNRVLGPSRQVNAKAQQLHDQVTIVDLHADSLLWGRDLLEKSSRGHVDVPRLQQGNVAIQAFTVVTKFPRKASLQTNDADSDAIGMLAIAEHWPPQTYSSLLERALYQAQRLREMQAQSRGKLTLIRTREDLDQFLQLRKSDVSIVAGFLGLEGAQALEGKLENLEPLYSAGFRMIAPTHFSDTEIAGSASGQNKGGLTELGRKFVREAEARHITIDLAHASSRTIDDVIAIATQPVVVSHTGVRGTCNNNRNLTDTQLRKIAKTGGVVGIGYWRSATCGTDAGAVARAIRYTANLIGVEHVALGSDFDGATAQPFDTTGVNQVTEALMKEGFSNDQITLIMGGNTVRVLRANLPSSTSP